MSFSGSKKEAKTFVSALRRELKKLNKPTGELSHNECLMVAAIAFGHSSWNEWEAKLADVPETTVASAAQPALYPLVNDGRYDFVPAGETGVPCEAINFMRVKGTSDIVLATAPVYSAVRAADGLIPEYDDDTEVCWDSQEVQKGADGASLWCPEGGSADVSETSLVLVPCDEDNDILPPDEWPVRMALVLAFLDFAKQQESLRGQTDDETLLASVTHTLGFTLTARERAVFFDQFHSSNAPRRQ
ncbi:hypothetical protein [Burkholderia cenocepacia]|uniref:hypothetical protein n=1 Tax=Burkholderia cenocepacia TaxID=95486 RepID=UPI00076D01AA|nr:hypothetical protein [Burkholderia cenocepacia]KWU19138.1 hypothetical protein AS149_12890 [Burkholderia cenocepacia]